MKIRLDVKGFKQEDKLGCGAAALRSVLNFFGKPMKEEEIIKSAGGIYKDEGYHGVLTIHLAAMLYKTGYKIHAYTYDMELFKPEWAYIGKEELIKNIEFLKKEVAKNNKRTSESILDSTLYLLKNNQDIKIKVPDKEDILSFLRKKLPVLISVRARLFLEKSELTPDIGHYLVIIGYDDAKRNFFIIDPFDGKEYAMEESKLLFAWHHNAIDSSDYLLAFEPK